MSEIPDRTQMLRIVAEAVAGGLPAPMTMDLHLYDTGNRSLQLVMDNNRADDVDAWVRAVSPDGDVSAVLGDRVHNTGGGPWRIYGYRYSADEPMWHGWQFDVWSAIDEPTYPAPGSAIPDMPGYVVGTCEHRVAFSEWRVGFRTCERCPKPVVAEQDAATEVPA